MAYTAKAKADAKILGAAVQTLYPTLFTSTSPVPLSIGIHRELQAAFPESTGVAVRRFLGWWTSRTAYLRALAADGSRRMNLRGETFEVSEAMRVAARLKLEYRKSKALSK